MIKKGDKVKVLTGADKGKNCLCTPSFPKRKQSFS
jgi:ribosomal protein L24